MAKILTLGPDGTRFTLPTDTDTGVFLGKFHGSQPFGTYATDSNGYEVSLVINPASVPWAAVQDD